MGIQPHIRNIARENDDLMNEYARAQDSTGLFIGTTAIRVE